MRPRLHVGHVLTCTYVSLAHQLHFFRGHQLKLLDRVLGDVGSAFIGLPLPLPLRLPTLISERAPLTLLLQPPLLSHHLLQITENREEKPPDRSPAGDG